MWVLVATPSWPPEELGLELAERLRQLGEGCAVAQRPRLALDHRQVVPPVVDGAAGNVVRALDDPGVLAHDLALGHHDEAVGIDPQAHRSVGERGGDAVAVALEVHEAGRRHPLGVLDEAVERPPHRHQARPLPRVDLGDAARQHPVGQFAPALDAAGLQPRVEGGQVCEGRHDLPDLPPGVLHVFLDLTFLPP